MSETYRVTVLAGGRIFRAQFHGVTPEKLEAIVIVAAKIAADPPGAVTIEIEPERRAVD